MSEVSARDKKVWYGLQVEMMAYDFGVTAFDLFYYITRKSDNKVIALAKTNMVCYNYEEKKMKDVPTQFLNLFQ